MLLQSTKLLYAVTTLLQILASTLASPLLFEIAPKPPNNTSSNNLTHAGNTTLNDMEFETPLRDHFVRFDNYRFDIRGMQLATWADSIQALAANFQVDMEHRHIHSNDPVPLWYGEGGNLDFEIVDLSPAGGGLTKVGIGVVLLRCFRYGAAWVRVGRVRLPGDIELVLRHPDQQGRILAQAKIKLLPPRRLRNGQGRNSSLLSSS